MRRWRLPEPGEVWSPDNNVRIAPDRTAYTETVCPFSLPSPCQRECKPTGPAHDTDECRLAALPDNQGCEQQNQNPKPHHINGTACGRSVSPTIYLLYTKTQVRHHLQARRQCHQARTITYTRTRGETRTMTPGEASPTGTPTSCLQCHHANDTYRRAREPPTTSLPQQLGMLWP